MTDKKKCPICDSETKETTYIDFGMVCEEYNECEGCNQYYWEFSYGTTRVSVGPYKFMWTYDRTFEEEMKIGKKITNAKLIVGALYRMRILGSLMVLLYLKNEAMFYIERMVNREKNRIA